MTPCTIMVVDDELPVQRVLARMLNGPERTVISATDGVAALALAAERMPDLILLDVNMPRKNGWEVLGELRRCPVTSLIPVIMLTGNGSVEDKVGGLGLGADDYVTKPFDGPELKARVEGLLKRHALAVSASPLTGLPGNFAIEAEVTRRIVSESPFALFHADIDRFKSYNDAYGFAAGDEVLLATAAIIRASAGKGFAGHIGGDDFALVLDLEDAPLAAHRLAAAFDERAPGFYSPDDRERGWVETQDRAGTLRRMPLLTLSVGIATTAHRSFSCYAEAAQIASEMKGFLKKRYGPGAALSGFAFDRRGGGRS